MVRTILFAVLCLAAGGASAGQQMYRWTGADGRVYYTDKPPPPDAKAVERKKLGDRSGSGPLPYALRQAVQAFPVTLFTTDCGGACDSGRQLLEGRGVPFTEKNAREEAAQAELRKLTGADAIDVPVLIVGKTVVRGWEAGQWNAALDAADYPKSSVLPKSPAAKPTPASRPDAGAAPKPADAARQKN